MERTELIKACKQNNLKAQMQVYHMYKDMLYNVSLRIVKNQHDAQDAVHDGFIKAFQNITTLEDDRHLGPWLKRIVVNCALDALRKQKKTTWLYDDNALANTEDDQDAYEESALKFEDVKKAIDQLADKYRIIIVLYLIEDYSHKEIAQQLGLKESTVRNQYRRGKRLLREQLQNSSVQ